MPKINRKNPKSKHPQFFMAMSLQAPLLTIAYYCLCNCLVVYVPEPNFFVPELKKLPIFHDPNYAVQCSPDEDKQPLVMP